MRYGRFALFGAIFFERTVDFLVVCPRRYCSNVDRLMVVDEEIRGSAAVLQIRWNIFCFCRVLCFMQRVVPTEPEFSSKFVERLQGLSNSGVSLRVVVRSGRFGDAC